ADDISFVRYGNGLLVAGPRRRIIVLRIALWIFHLKRRLSPFAVSLLPTPDHPMIDLAQRSKRGRENVEIGLELGFGLVHGVLFGTSRRSGLELGLGAGGCGSGSGGHGLLST